MLTAWLSYQPACDNSQSLRKEIGMAPKILGIVGSYRKGCVIDTLVSTALSAAKEAGATTSKIYLQDKHIEFCINCRQCTQEPGTMYGQCIHHDDIASILQEIESSDGIVLGAPVNFFNVTAIMRRFMERLVCYAYWPWGHHAPQLRNKVKNKRAVLITATAMPAFFGRLLTGAVRALKITAEVLHAKTVATIFAGTIADTEHPTVPLKFIQQAQKAGRKLLA